MILIADSGSTKCDWLLIDGNNENIAQCSSMGFNPYFHKESFIVTTLRGHEVLMRYAQEVKHIYFYGAGGSSPELRSVISKALVRLFPSSLIKVGHDLDAAALSTYSGEPHIACILGTGSNSCYFDGSNVHEEIPALAYILGDEGSGSYFGKRLLADFLYRKMPLHLANDFETTYNLNMKEIVDHVYTRPHANVYLASFMRFCSKHREDPYIKTMVFEGLQKFLGTHVTCYPNYRDVAVNFVGSVAYYFEDVLREAAKEYEIQIGRVVKKPILGLKAYHLEFSLSSVN